MAKQIRVNIMQIRRICVRLVTDSQKKKKKEKRNKPLNCYSYAKSKKLTHFNSKIEKFRIHMRTIT